MFRAVDSDDNTPVTSHKPPSSHLDSDAQNPNQNFPDAKDHNSRDLTFNMLLREFVVCLALALTTYGALHSSPPKISKHPRAVNFFGKGSPVTDWYHGQLSEALSIIGHADVSLVMYYAPWDAECQHVRKQFSKAASVMSDRVHFAAINCWNPGSECRLKHNKIPTWPVIMAYTVNSHGILYKGPRDAHSIVKFLELIMTPLRRVSSAEDLVNLLALCDAVAVGYTPLTESSKYYNMWYSVALKFREVDVLGEVCFASVTSEELSADLGLDLVPSVRLMLWNETKEYQGDHESWTDSLLIRWILENFTQPAAQIVPMWQKAFSFQPYIDGSPLLILFTPLNPLYDQMPAYDLLREVAMEYQNCNDNQWTTELIRLLQVQRFLYQQKNVFKQCKEYSNKRPIVKSNNYHNREILAQYSKVSWHNVTQTKKQRSAGLFGFLLKHGLSVSDASASADHGNGFMSSVKLFEECQNNLFPAEQSCYTGYEKCAVSEAEPHLPQEDPENVQTTMLPDEDDPLSAERLVQEHMRALCKVLRFGRELSEPVGVRPEAHDTGVPALACQRNRTLKFIAIDSVRNHHFAESLGVDIMNAPDKTAVVILDSKLESQFQLTEPYGAKTLREFILNYTSMNLKRSLRSHIENATHTHYYGPDSEDMENDSSDDTIVDLTTESFSKFIKIRGSVGMVAVCGGACPALTTRALAAATRLLRACQVRVRPARLDALRHDLPWHYTVHQHPTLLVFPTDGRRESRAYPVGERVSAGGLVALALRSLGAPAHLRVRLLLCARPQPAENKKICMKDLRHHVVTLIGRNLKYWRRFHDPTTKKALFKRLQNLRQVSLELELLHVTEVYDKSPRQIPVLDSLTNLANDWDIAVKVKDASTEESRSKERSL